MHVSLPVRQRSCGASPLTERFFGVLEKTKKEKNNPRGLRRPPRGPSGAWRGEHQKRRKVRNKIFKFEETEDEERKDEKG